MSGLPRTLAPWAALLAPLTDDLKLVIGEWARRVAACLGPREATIAATGEPDGFSGITRRGSYERLLLTEWLLARELPDEFTRRAAMGEHLFLDRGRRSPAAGQGLTALVDAGPDQLGTPRIAQLAVLVVLAARAEAAGTGFSWGVAQDPAAGLHQGFAEEVVRRFLAARTRTPAGPEHRDGWAAAVAAAGRGLWLLGGATFLGTMPEGGSQVLIEELPSPAERSLRLEVRRGRSAPRELCLALPSAPDCTRLLRDPFRSAPVLEDQPARRQGAEVIKGTIQAEAGILFSPSGRRAAVRLQGGWILDLHIPAAGAEPVRRPRRRQVAADLVAYGSAARARQFLVRWPSGSTGESRLLLERGRSISSATLVGGTPLPEAIGERALLPGVHRWPRREGQERYWFLDARRTLYVISPGGRTSMVAGEVSAVVSGENLAFVSIREGAAELEVHRRAVDELKPVQRFPLGPSTGRAFLALAGNCVFGAVETSRAGLWSLFRSTGTTVQPLRSCQSLPGATIVGLLCHHGCELLVLEADGMTFTAIGTNQAWTVLREDRGVAAAAMDPGGHTLGYVTRRGWLVFRTPVPKLGRPSQDKYLEWRFEGEG